MALNIISNVQLDMKAPNTVIVYANQYDSAGSVRAQLLNSGESWAVPAGAKAVVMFKKSDKIGGFYDVTEFGVAAVEIDSDRSVIYINYDPQVLTTAGRVAIQINFYQNDQRLSSFAFYTDVQASAVTSGEIASSWLFNILSQEIAQTLTVATTPQAMTDWLEANITQETGYVIDNTLTVAGAASDAQATGKMVTVSNLNPNTVANKVWVKKTPATIDIPTCKEVDELKSAINTVNQIFEIDDGILRKDDADYVVRVKTSVSDLTDDPEGTRIRVIFHLTESGCNVKAQCSAGKGTLLTLYNTAAHACFAGETGKIQVGSDGYSYTKSETTMLTTNEGWLVASLSKNDGSVISESDMEELVAAFTIEIVYPREAREARSVRIDNNEKILNSTIKSINPIVAPGKSVQLTSSDFVAGTWSGRRIVPDNNTVAIETMIHVTKGSRLIIGNNPDNQHYAYGIYENDNTVSSGYSFMQTAANKEYILNYTGELFVQVRKSNEQAGILPSDVTVEISVVGYDFIKATEEIDYITYNKSTADADVHHVDTSSTTETPTGTRLRLVYKVPKGVKFDASCSIGSGVSSALYDSLSNAVYGSTDYIEYYGNNVGYLPYNEGICSCDGYLSISLKKSDGSSISVSEVETFLSNTTINIKGFVSKLEDAYNTSEVKSALKQDDPFLYPGQTINLYPNRVSLKNGTWSERQIVYESNRVCFGHMFHVQKRDTLHIGTLQDGIRIAYGVYQADNTFSEYSGWLSLSEQDIVINYTGELFVQFRREPEASLSPSYITTEISITSSDVASEFSDVDDITAFDVHQVAGGSVVETPRGTRLRIVKKLFKGTFISVRGTYERGAVAYLYATEYDAIYATNNYIQTFGKTSYSTDEMSGFLMYDGYLSISEMKIDGTSISEAEKESFLAGTTVLIEGKYSKIYKNVVDGSFVVKNELANGTIVNPANAYAVRTVNYVSVYPGDTVIFGTNKPFKAKGNSYSYGYQTYDADKNVVRNLNYTSITTNNALLIENGEYYVRFVIAEYSASPKEVQTNRVSDFDGYDVTVTINGAVSIPNFYFLSNRNNTDDKETESTEELNRDMDSELAAMSGYNTFKSGTAGSATGYKKNFSLAIITDIHGSSDAFSRFISYVNSKKKYFDVALCTGDIVLYNPSYDVSWFTSTLTKSEIPFLFTVGNHDTADTGSAGITQAEARAKYFTEIESKNWITSGEFMGSGKCSWVKDFEDYNIRVVSLFEYGNSTTIASDAPGSYCRRWMDSELLQWFADTLYGTPNGYSVIVLLHQVPNDDVVYIDDKFTAVHGIRQEPPHFLNTMDGNPVEDIVDAFMNSTVINQSYMSNSYIPGKTASVSKDFSGRTENGSFICYVCGHAHISYILQSASYQNQKTIVVNTGSENMYQRQYSDTNYDPDTRSKDCFYGIGFDTQRRTINLVQLGGQETIDMRKRDFTSIPY